MRVILSLFLSLILVWAAQAEAVARSEMAGAVDQVICGSQGPALVRLDARGEALAPHSCQHCLAAHLPADLPGAVAWLLPGQGAGLRLRPSLILRNVGQSPPLALARAPPVLLV